MFTFFSFPLNRRWGFTGDIVDDAVNMGDLIDDAGGGAVEDVVGDTSPIGGHEVGGGDAALALEQCRNTAPSDKPNSEIS